MTKKISCKTYLQVFAKCIGNQWKAGGCFFGTVIIVLVCIGIVAAVIGPWFIGYSYNYWKGKNMATGCYPHEEEYFKKNDIKKWDCHSGKWMYQHGFSQSVCSSVPIVGFGGCWVVGAGLAMLVFAAFAGIVWIAELGKESVVHWNGALQDVIVDKDN